MEKLAFNFPGYSIEGVSGMPEGGVDTFGKTLQVGITLLFITVTIAALIFLILGGIQWIISQGDKTKVEAARKKITYAIIGLIVAFASYLIINTVGDFFGVKLLSVPASVRPLCGPEHPDGGCTDRKKSCQLYEGRWQCACRPHVSGCAF